MTLTQHFLSSSYPSMSDDEFQSLKDSISEIGVQSPIVIFEGQVIDGWNRYKASLELDMPCPSVAFDTDINPVDFVKAMNDARRHLTASQRAIAAVSIYQWRPSAGRPINTVPGTELLKTTKEIAKESGVSVTMIEKAKAAHKAGYADAVKDGALTVKEAATLASNKPAKVTHKPEKFTQPAADTSEDELAESAQAINELSEEVDVLKAQLAVKHMDGTGEEKLQATGLITELRAEVKNLNAELDAMRSSRDGLQRENRELMKQIQIYQRQLKQAQKA